MPPGPKPTPLKLKILQGNPGKRKLNTEEPKYEPVLPPMPKGLDRFERQQWEWISTTMIKAKSATSADVGLILIACNAWSMFQRAREYMKRRTFTFMSTRTNKDGAVTKLKRTHPELAQLNMARRAYQSALADLGLTTVTRGRVKANPDTGNSGINEYFKS